MIILQVAVFQRVEIFRTVSGKSGLLGFPTAIVRTVSEQFGCFAPLLAILRSVTAKSGQRRNPIIQEIVSPVFADRCDKKLGTNKVGIVHMWALLIREGRRLVLPLAALRSWRGLRRAVRIRECARR